MKSVDYIDTDNEHNRAIIMTKVEAQATQTALEYLIREIRTVGVLADDKTSILQIERLLTMLRNA